MTLFPMILRRLLFVAAAGSVLAFSAHGFAGLTVNHLDDAAAWPGTPTISTTGTHNLQTDFNTEVTMPVLECEGTGGCNGAATHTFVAETDFQLDKFIIRLAGGATTGEIFLYPEPVGGTEADGFINVSFSTSLLNGGAGLPFEFFGTPTRTLLELDLTGDDEIFLSAGTKYALDIQNTGYPDVFESMYWMRGDTNEYAGGNIYETTSGTQPGERYDVAGGGRRDAALAVYGFATAGGTPGDYNDDGTVDAADYVVWRKNLGTSNTLPNDDEIGGTIGEDHYDLWVMNFGDGGGGAGALVAAAPEPASWLLAAVAVCVFASRRQRR
jgi:hypothetical protein